MNKNEAIHLLKSRVSNPSEGLPDDIFYYISSVTPLINVDLLIKDEKGRTLLSWRDDKYAGTGWHVPGGIIRFKETIETRIRKVAETEIGVEISYSLIPSAINEIISSSTVERGHFISLLYMCKLGSSFKPANKGLVAGMPGFLMWHESCPDDLLKLQDIYRVFI